MDLGHYAELPKVAGAVIKATSRKRRATACASTFSVRIVRKKLNVSVAKCLIREDLSLSKFFSWLTRASQLSCQHRAMLANTRALIQQ